jgi:hypothetical protein
MVRRVLIAVGVVLLVSGGVGIWLWWTAQPAPKGDVYVCMNKTTLWDGNGQIRRPLADLTWGEKLAVLDEYNDSVKVRTPKGKIGWVAGDRLIDPGVWQRLGQLADRVRQMTTQAPAHTAVRSNLRLDPGRDSPRVGQLRPNTPVEVLARGVATRSTSSAAARDTSRKEDWLLVRARTKNGTELAGWVLASFISLDLPDPLPAYATSAGMTPVAYFPLHTVDDPTSGPKAYYLVAGENGPQGQPCDFTMLRVYTWNIKKQRYETAFVQNNVCGHLPIRVERNADAQHDSLFSFDNFSDAGSGQLTYRMRSTMVRLLKSPSGTHNAKHAQSSAAQAARRR